MASGRSLSRLATERWHTRRKGCVKTGREGGLHRGRGRRTQTATGRGGQAQQMDNVTGIAHIKESGNLRGIIIAGVRPFRLVLTQLYEITKLMGWMVHQSGRGSY